MAQIVQHNALPFLDMTYYTEGERVRAGFFFKLGRDILLDTARAPLFRLRLCEEPAAACDRCLWCWYVLHPAAGGPVLQYSCQHCESHMLQCAPSIKASSAAAGPVLVYSCQHCESHMLQCAPSINYISFSLSLSLLFHSQHHYSIFNYFKIYFMNNKF
jgi:hypothetical protein